MTNLINRASGYVPSGFAGIENSCRVEVFPASNSYDVVKDDGFVSVVENSTRNCRI